MRIDSSSLRFLSVTQDGNHWPSQLSAFSSKLTNASHLFRPGHPLVTVILDFELDMFVPTFFKHGQTSGLVAARALRTRVRENLQPNIDPDKAIINVTILLNVERKQDLVFDMLAEGVIRAPGDLDSFVSGKSQTKRVNHRPTDRALVSPTDQLVQPHAPTLSGHPNLLPSARAPGPPPRPRAPSHPPPALVPRPPRPLGPRPPIVRPARAAGHLPEPGKQAHPYARDRRVPRAVPGPVAPA